MNLVQIKILPLIKNNKLSPWGYLSGKGGHICIVEMLHSLPVRDRGDFTSKKVMWLIKQLWCFYFTFYVIYDLIIFD